MEDLEPYTRFIDRYASYGYALLFARLGDFSKAERALENALVDGYAYWRLHWREAGDRPDTMAVLVEKFGRAGEAAENAVSPLGQSQKLQAVAAALDLLRSFSAEEQVAIVLSQVEEAAPDRIVEWMDRDPAFLAGVRTTLEKKLAGWTPATATPEDPASFFVRTLRQHRLTPQFSDAVLQRLRTFRPNWRGLGALAGWGVLIGVPFVSLSYFHDYGWNTYNYEGSGWRASESVLLLQQLSIDFATALAAALLYRYFTRRAPQKLADETSGLTPLLGLGMMAGFGFVICEALVLLETTPLRGLMRSGWSFWRTLWSVGTISVVLVALYRIGVHVLARLDAPRREPGGPT